MAFLIFKVTMGWYLRYENKDDNKIFPILLHIYIVLCRYHRIVLRLDGAIISCVKGIYSAFWVQLIFGCVEAKGMPFRVEGFSG